MPLAVEAPLLGYRYWRVTPSGALASIYALSEWEAAGVTARCPGGGHTPPAKDCSCGLYAFLERPSPGRFSRFEMRLDRMVWGAVVATGKAQVYDNGWRAEKARPLCVSSSLWVRGAFLRDLEKGSVQVVPSDDVVSFASEHGRHLPPAPSARRRLFAPPLEVWFYGEVIGRVAGIMAFVAALVAALEIAEGWPALDVIAQVGVLWLTLFTAVSICLTIKARRNRR